MPKVVVRAGTTVRMLTASQGAEYGSQANHPHRWRLIARELTSESCRRLRRPGRAGNGSGNEPQASRVLLEP